MKKAFGLALAILISGQAQAAEKEVQAFMTYETFVQLPEQARQFYVSGLADAFIYLEWKTGRMARVWGVPATKQCNHKAD